MFNRTACILLLMVVFKMQAFSQEKACLNGLHKAFGERVSEREEMVKDGIENYPHQPVRDPKVLEAMRRVPRHVFIPLDYRQESYKNRPIVIGYNQTISQPFIVASMTEILDIQIDHRILEIGTGSGYQAAVLGELCKHVYTIEIISSLGLKAKKLLAELGYEHIQVKIGDGYEGWPDVAPFDRIIVTCAPNKIPPPLIDQLARGGKIVIPVGKANQIQYVVVVTKDKQGRVSQERRYPVRFVPMTGKASQMNFVP